MTNRISFFAAGSSSTFSLAALAEFIRSVNWTSFISLIGSVCATGISYYVAARQAKRDQDRRDRDELREARIADMLAEIRLAEMKSRDVLHVPTMPAGDLSRPHSEGS
jgi:hypothetical protein